MHQLNKSNTIKKKIKNSLVDCKHGDETLWMWS
jgi:hypothetical protein